MRIFRSLQEIPPDYGPSVVTIGNFDGVHRGHQAVIADVTKRARTLGARAVAATFDPHPLRVLRPQVLLRLIAPLNEKLDLLEQTGLDAVAVLPFTAEFSRQTAGEFARAVLHDALQAIEVHEGENFHFGIDAKADIHELAAIGKKLGFATYAHRPIFWRGMEVSSSKIRAAIADGDIRKARQLLGRPFEILSRTATGRGYGSRLTVPTVNLASYEELVPANGVYVTCIEIAGQQFPSVSNVGTRPTFGEGSFAIEAHILDFQPITIDATTPLRLQFLDRLRGEQKWPSPEALKEQILRDAARARHYFDLFRAVTPFPT